VSHPVDGRPVDTYFYEPPNEDFSALAAFGRANAESVGALLVGFFYHLGCDLDLSAQAVSVRRGAVPLPKLLKAEGDCWPSHARLSIEDPFETW
jgi:DNA polymerase sigma